MEYIVKNRIQFEKNNSIVVYDKGATVMLGDFPSEKFMGGFLMAGQLVKKEAPKKASKKEGATNEEAN